MKSITMNWDAIRANSKIKKGKRGGPFVSRNSHYKQSAKYSTRPAPIEREKIELEKTDTPLKEEKGKYYFSGRVKGKFARLEISDSLAEKLKM